MTLTASQHPRHFKLRFLRRTPGADRIKTLNPQAKITLLTSRIHNGELIRVQIQEIPDLSFNYA